MQKIKLIPLIFSNLLGLLLGNYFHIALAQPSEDIIYQTGYSIVSISKESGKTIIIGVFITLLFVYFLVCLSILLWVNDPKKVEFAFDNIKFLTAFFIGSITGYLG